MFKNYYVLHYLHTIMCFNMVRSIPTYTYLIIILNLKFFSVLFYTWKFGIIPFFINNNFINFINNNIMYNYKQLYVI